MGAAVTTRPAGPGARLAAWIRSREFFDAVVLTTLIRACLLVAAAIAVTILGDERARARDFLQIWNAWDTPHYLAIASGGYDPAGDPALVAFFPLLPMLIRAGSAVLPPLAAGLLISYLATVAAAIGLHRLARLDGGSAGIARNAVLAMNLSPTSFALVAPYTEPLFLALVIWAFVAARRDDWLGTGMLGLLAAVTRLQGVLLLPSLAVEAFARHRRLRWGMAPLLLVAAGPLIYLGINWLAYGDPFFFVGVQESIFFHRAAPPWDVLANLWRGVATVRWDQEWALVYVAPAIAFVVLAAVFGWTLVSRRSRTSYAVYTGLTLLSLAMLTWPISTPRYLLGVFPLFLAIAGPARRPEIGIPLLVGSVVLLLAFLAQFSIGGWAF
ncbi:MAG: hypothetical protein H6Q36_331 [Chloroflexi bacterium]|nr:hypothetical protein [Chloroflexota bacterium]